MQKRRDHKITLSDELWDFAKTITNGNASAGIASLLSVELYGTPRIETTTYTHRDRPGQAFVQNLHNLLTFDGYKGELVNKNPPQDFWQPIYIDHTIVTLERTRKDAMRERLQLPTPETIWALVFGHWPTNPVVHHDGDSTNNHLDNLRTQETP